MHGVNKIKSYFALTWKTL